MRMRQCLLLVPLFAFTHSASGGPEDSGNYIEIEICVKSYCPCQLCCGPHADGKYATGRRIRSTDYAFAVSRDLEPYFPLDEATLFIPGYNRPGTISIARDRTHRKRRHQIEVLMTVSKRDARGRWRTPHERAMDWGRRKLRLRVRAR